MALEISKPLKIHAPYFASLKTVCALYTTFASNDFPIFHFSI